MAFVYLILLILTCYLPLRLALASVLRPFPALERVALCVLSTYVLFFLMGMASFATQGPAFLIHAVALVVLVLWAISSRFLGRAVSDFWPSSEELKILAIFILAACWALLVQMSLVNYSGGGWYGDWYEHYERATFFAGHLDADHRFLDVYPLTSRPPLFNVLSYVLLTFIGFSYSHYQVVATLLNSSILLAAAMLFSWFIDGKHVNASGPTTLAFVSIALMMHPMAVTNILYPWTRMLANAFLLMGLYFFVKALCENRSSYLPVSFLFLSAAHLTHYSVDSFILPLLVVLAYKTAKDLNRFTRPAFTALLTALAVNGMWFVWAFARYGMQAFTSNTPWTVIRNHSMGEIAGVIAGNVRVTLLPFLAEVDPGDVQQMDSSLYFYALYDRLHLFWTGSLVGAISASAVVTVLLSLLSWASVTNRYRRPLADEGPGSSSWCSRQAHVWVFWRYHGRNHRASHIFRSSRSASFSFWRSRGLYGKPRLGSRPPSRACTDWRHSSSITSRL